jgi:hypothetical protein
MDVSTPFISRVAARRADFRFALRTGDAVGAARAASRLLIVADVLDPVTGKRIRDARERLGHGLRLARRRRAVGAIEIAVNAPSAPAAAPRSTDRNRWALVAVLAVIALLLIQFIPSTTTSQDEGGGGGVAAIPDQVSTTIALRGRTSNIATPSPIAVVSAAPVETPEPSSEPTARPVAVVAPARTGTPGGTGNVGGGSGSGTGQGSGSGSGSGAGSGSGSGTPPPTPTPTPAPTPLPSVDPTYGRLSIYVVDSGGHPLAGVCVIVGTLSCAVAHTDATGHWSADVPLATPTLLWDVGLSKPGYSPIQFQILLRTGQTVQRTATLDLKNN